MRDSRESNELKEKNDYLSRILKQRIDEVRHLEEANAEFEAQIYKKQEEFRKADNFRLKKFFEGRWQEVDINQH